MKTLGEILYENGNLIYFGEYGDYAGEADFCISTHEAVSNAVIAEYERRQWREIAEHDGGDAPVDLWAKGARYTNCVFSGSNEGVKGFYWRSVFDDYGRWGWNQVPTPITHFRPVPAPPEVRGNE